MSTNYLLVHHSNFTPFRVSTFSARYLGAKATISLVSTKSHSFPIDRTIYYYRGSSMYGLLNSLNSRDLFLNLRRLVKMTKPLRFENKSLRLKYKCLICIWIIFWAILDLFINPKYLFQNKSFSQTYYFKSEKSFVILTSLLGLKINPGNLESDFTLNLSKTH